MSDDLMFPKFAAHWLRRLAVTPGKAPDLAARAPNAVPPRLSKNSAREHMAHLLPEIDRLQYLLYADARSSLLIVLQGLDAAGKDGTIRHVMSAMNPQGVRVVSFKQPTPVETAHDFLWRVHKVAPGRGEVAVFNRSHYEDVLITRVHELLPHATLQARFAQINAFEELLAANGTKILKFFLHISPEEQLKRFRERLNDPARQWKISESDYTERQFWSRYMDAYEEAIERTSTPTAPWYVIPSDRKWVRNLAVGQIVAQALNAMHLSTPPISVNLADIRKRFHDAQAEQD